LEPLIVLRTENSDADLRKQQAPVRIEADSYFPVFGWQAQCLFELRKQEDQYMKEILFTDDHATVPLPNGRTAPQPLTPIVDMFAFRNCPFKSQSRNAARKHGNKAHNKSVVNEDMFETVRLQWLFGEKRYQHWVVDESQQVEQERRAR
jgi:hypothetical protein